MKIIDYYKSLYASNMNHFRLAEKFDKQHSKGYIFEHDSAAYKKARYHEEVALRQHREGRMLTDWQKQEIYDSYFPKSKK